ncbi:hypothetical protein BU23DRAFT_115261 [Bimuria novae-zelandiae CBS 107.79]|uniref:Uncharacterized protein n=1 Tax=Bimuria novae-zelandiae CBS 107.79 TaxID=1447943 RepID=A0A6A5VCA6_9PLEO|nr:hypothetical protein BU23DRAFT_115261 [Bimuria novae-zelandiae CBS 107.79]
MVQISPRVIAYALHLIPRVFPYACLLKCLSKPSTPSFASADDVLICTNIISFPASFPSKCPFSLFILHSFLRSLYPLHFFIFPLRRDDRNARASNIAGPPQSQPRNIYHVRNQKLIALPSESVCVRRSTGRKTRTDEASGETTDDRRIRFELWRRGPPHT